MSKNIVVIGAGISGLTVAIALKKLGYSVSVFERAKKLENIGGAFILFPNGIYALKALGLGHIVEALNIQINYASNYDEDGELLAFGSLQSFYEQTGDQVYTFERAKFQQLLLKTLENEGVSVHYDYTCDGIKESQDSVYAHFTNGKIVKADYLFGADGIHSNVRKCINPEVQSQYAGICAFGGIIEKAVDLHEFHIANDQLVSHFGLDQSLWLSPLPEGKQAFYIHVRLSKDEFDSYGDKWVLLKNIISGWGHSKLAQKITEAILAQGKTKNCFAVATHEVHPLKNLVSNNGHVILIGDAGHGFSSKAGLGTTLALDDALMAVICLKLNVLNKYQHIRLPIAKRFYDLEKEDEKTDLTHDSNAIAQRNQNLRQSATLQPMWNGWVPVSQGTSLGRQLASLQLSLASRL